MNSDAPAYWVYIGSYSMETGIHLFRLDAASGKLEPHGLAAKVARANFQAIAPSEKYLFSGTRYMLPGDQKLDKIGGFAIDRKTGKLNAINEQATGGENPCFIEIDSGGKNALVAHYESCSVAVLPIDGEGKLAPPSVVMKQTGSSVNPKRQAHSHPHSINLDKESRFAFVPDLGADKVFVYRFDATAGSLTPSNPPTVSLPPGSGPRHWAFHTSGKFAYLVSEMTNRLTAYRYDAKEGVLHEMQSISMLPGDFTGGGQAAEVQVHPNGKFLYASNRGHNSIAIFAIDLQSGKLTAIGHESTRGDWPRNFRVDPSGRWLIAANQRSDSISVYRLDQSTGLLKSVGDLQTVPQPSCVKFLAIP